MFLQTLNDLSVSLNKQSSTGAWKERSMEKASSSRSTPKLVHTGRAVTLTAELESPQKERRKVEMKIGEYGEDEEEKPDSLYSSDSSGIVSKKKTMANKINTLAGSYSPQVFRPPRNYNRRPLEHLDQFSQPQGQGFTHAHHESRSSDNLLGMAHSGGEWSSSDEGEVVIECSICLQQFEEESMKTPRNLQCGHAYCTGEMKMS